jgi:hypothetical protein
VYPNDIILYTFNNVFTPNEGKAWTAVGLGAQKGIIYYRKDTERSVEAPYDWRQVRFRRWRIDYSVSPLPSTPLSQYAGAQHYALWAPTVTGIGKDPT